MTFGRTKSDDSRAGRSVVSVRSATDAAGLAHLDASSPDKRDFAMGAGELITGLSKFAMEIGESVMGAGDIVARSAKTVAGAGELVMGTGNLTMTAGEAMAGVGRSMIGAGRSMAGAGDPMTGAGEVVTRAGTVVTKAGTVVTKAGETPSGAGALVAGADKLNIGSSQLRVVPGSGVLSTGANQPAMGAGGLATGAGARTGRDPRSGRILRPAGSSTKSGGRELINDSGSGWLMVAGMLTVAGAATWRRPRGGVLHQRERHQQWSYSGKPGDGEDTETRTGSPLLGCVESGRSTGSWAGTRPSVRSEEESSPPRGSGRQAPPVALSAGPRVAGCPS